MLKYISGIFRNYSKHFYSEMILSKMSYETQRTSLKRSKTQRRIFFAEEKIQRRKLLLKRSKIQRRKSFIKVYNTKTLSQLNS
jgi:hypothetical protein